jgi:hypothetical protein
MFGEGMSWLLFRKCLGRPKPKPRQDNDDKLKVIRDESRDGSPKLEVKRI